MYKRQDDGTGLYYYRARYYDPTLGRFVSEDRLGFGSGDVNFYAYVGNNPVNANDPTGNCPSCIGAGTSMLLGGTIRYFASGGDWGAVFDPKAIAVDAALGAVGVGLAGKLKQGAELLARSQLASRAEAIHAAVGGVRTQQATTVAITRSTTQSGGTVNIVTSSEGALRPAQRALLSADEIAGKVPRALAQDAEINGLRVAEQLGLTPRVTAASRPICTGCEAALDDAGVGFASTLKSGNPMSMGQNLPSLSFGESAFVGGIIGGGVNAAGGFLLYPNKANLNMLQSIYTK